MVNKINQSNCMLNKCKNHCTFSNCSSQPNSPAWLKEMASPGAKDPIPPVVQPVVNLPTLKERDVWRARVIATVMINARKVWCVARQTVGTMGTGSKRPTAVARRRKMTRTPPPPN